MACARGWIGGGSSFSWVFPAWDAIDKTRLEVKGHPRTGVRTGRNTESTSYRRSQCCSRNWAAEPYLVLPFYGGVDRGRGFVFLDGAGEQTNGMSARVFFIAVLGVAYLSLTGTVLHYYTTLL